MERNLASRGVALITGGSRGIGAETALALAKRGYNVAISYRNKVARANELVAAIERNGVRGLAVGCDMTHTGDLDRLFATLSVWSHSLNLLILNASGGLERDRVAADPAYPMHINHDAQLALVERALPLMPPESTVVFVTSHWAHLYGRVAQIPAYEPVAASKYAGEQALRARQQELAEKSIRLLVVTGDLIEGTITPKLLERHTPGLIAETQRSSGQLPTAAEMGELIAASALENAFLTGATIVIGRPLTSFVTS